MKHIAVLLALLVSTAFAQDFKIDPAHSSATFTVRHMMISNVSGRFSDVTGTIHYDEKDISKSTVDAVIKTASVDTGNAMRDNDLRSDSFFDVQKYPEMTFKSTKVEKRGDQLVAIGNMTIKDVTRQVELPFEIAKLNTPKGARIGVTAESKLNRKDYHINWNRMMDSGGAVVSDEVKFTLSVEAQEVKPEAAAPMTAPPAKK